MISPDAWKRMDPKERGDYSVAQALTIAAAILGLVAFGGAFLTESPGKSLLYGLGGIVVSMFGLVQFHHMTTVSTRVQRDIDLRRR